MKTKEINLLTPEDYITQNSITDLHNFYKEELNKRQVRRKSMWDDPTWKIFHAIAANQISDHLGILLDYEKKNLFPPVSISFSKNQLGLVCSAEYLVPFTDMAFSMDYSAKIQNSLNQITEYNNAFLEYILSFSEVGNPNETDDINIIYNQTYKFIAKNSSIFLK